MCKIRFRGRRADNGDWVRGGNILQFAGDGQTDCYLAPSGKTFACRDDDAGNIAEIESCRFYKVDPETVEIVWAEDTALVRCRDCSFCGADGLYFRPEGGYMPVEPEDFCSRGARREDV